MASQGTVNLSRFSSVDFFYLYDKAAGLLESKIVFFLTLADRGRPCFVFSN